MSEQKWKFVPVEPTEEMNKAGMRWLTGIQHMRAGDRRNALNEAFKAMVALAPQPPVLGGEPEVLGWLVESHNGTCLTNYVQRPDWAYRENPKVYSIIELVDRAHVTRLQADLALFKDTDLKVEALREQEAEIARLQAEVERLNARLSSEQDRVMANIGQYAKFEARTAALEGLLRDAVGEIDFYRGDKHACKGLDIDAARAALA